MIYLGSDHAGFQHKEALKKKLSKEHLAFTDVGTDGPESADYPVFVKKAVSSMDLGHDKAILLCGSGEGMAMMANKYPGVRAAVCWNPEVALESRQDNDANVLALPSRFISSSTALKIAQTFLKTPFSGAIRHRRRIKALHQAERG